jgi:hypothetical protein
MFRGVASPLLSLSFRPEGEISLEIMVEMGVGMGDRWFEISPCGRDDKRGGR